MIILTKTGSVDPDSNLPRFVDVFPSFVDPNKILVSDGFTINRATLTNGATDYGGLSWSAGTSFTTTYGSDGGFVVRAAASTGAQTIDISQANHKVYAAIKWITGASGFVSVVARWSDSSNYWRAALSSSTGIQLAKFVAGVQTTVDTQAQTFIADQVYMLALECTDDDDINVYLDHELIMTTNDAALNTNDMVGIQANAVLPRYMEFVAGTV